MSELTDQLDAELRELHRREALLAPEVRTSYDYVKAHLCKDLMGLHTQKLMTELLRLTADDPDGHVLTIKDKAHPSGVRYVMAYHERETAEILLAREKERGVNTGMSVRAFRLLAGQETG